MSRLKICKLASPGLPGASLSVEALGTLFLQPWTLNPNLKPNCEPNGHALCSLAENGELFGGAVPERNLTLNPKPSHLVLQLRSLAENGELFGGVVPERLTRKGAFSTTLMNLWPKTPNPRSSDQASQCAALMRMVSCSAARCRSARGARARSPR